VSDREHDLGNLFSVIAIAIAVVALLIGAVLPEAGDIAIDLGLNDLNDVNTSGVLGSQTITWNGVSWVPSSFSNVTVLNDLNDVNTNGVLVNQAITWDGANWVPASFSNQTVSFGYDDLNFPALSLTKSASLTPNLGAILGSGGIQGYLFNGAGQTNEVFGAGEILHSYEQGTNLYPHIHWMASTANAGNVTWFLEYSIANTLGTYTSTTTINVTTATTNAAWVHIFSSLPTINGAGLNIGSQIVFRLYRNSSATTDTYGYDASLISFGIHYKTNSFGSSGEFSK
jgi:hypothetical protein